MTTTNSMQDSDSPPHHPTTSPPHYPTTSLPRHVTVALLGNPNTGKTTLFNALAGMRQRVGNYPGVTVETKKGQVTCQGQVFQLIDLPGTYSLAPRSPDEMLAVDLILGQQPGEARPDVIIAIVDASNLERNLYLTTQAMELGVPVVVALNMVDVAERQGMRIDVDRLSRQLGAPVVPIQANKGKGLEQLKQAICAIANCQLPIANCQLPGLISWPAAFEREATLLHHAIGDRVPSFLMRRLLLDVSGYTERCLAERYGADGRDLVPAARQRLTEAGCPVPGVEARTRYGWIKQATAGCIERPEKRRVTGTDRLDRVLTHKVWGTLIFLALMFIVFQSIFTWARPLMKAIGASKDMLAETLRELPAGPLTSLLADGIVEGVGSVLVFLPQILILFGFIAILEDCGYMARAAYLMDRLMAHCGLSGKSFIPLLSSVACAVPGIMATRVIENRRDRLATIMVAPLMSCSARLPIYILLTAVFLNEPWWLPGVVMFSMYAIGLVVAPLVALVLKRTLLRGETPVFVMEMPLYKLPSPRAVLQRMSDSAWAFVRRAGTLILASMIVVWALLYFPAASADGTRYEQEIARLQTDLKNAEGSEAREPIEERINDLHAEWKGQSLLGRAGHALEPVVRPLGWDWKIGMAALASFPAREVVVGTLGIIYNVGKVDADEIRDADNAADTQLGQTLKKQGTLTVPVALSIMVFFALCCQCASTLVVIKRETRSWRWPIFTFVYMTVLAYVGALLVYQVSSLIG